MASETNGQTLDPVYTEMNTVDDDSIDDLGEVKK